MYTTFLSINRLFAIVDGHLNVLTRMNEEPYCNASLLLRSGSSTLLLLIHTLRLLEFVIRHDTNVFTATGLLYFTRTVLR